MAKTGRRRKNNVKRQPNGQASRSRSGKRESVMAVALRQPHRASLPDAQRRDQRAESMLGRMSLAGLLSEVELLAGERLGRAIATFGVELAQPLGSRCTLGMITAPGTEPEPEETQSRQKDAREETPEERASRVLGQYDAAMAALDGATGGLREHARLVLSVCVEGYACPRERFPMFKSMLAAMAVSMGIREPSDKRRMRVYAPGVRTPGTTPGRLEPRDAVGDA